MSLFGGKKDTAVKAGVKEPKRKKKKKNPDDSVPLDENPAFQVYAPGISDDNQSLSLLEEQSSPDYIPGQQAFTPQVYNNAEPDPQAVDVAGLMPTAPVAIDPQTGLPYGTVQPTIDPNTGLPMGAVQPAIDPSTGLPMGTVQPAIDPNTGLPMEAVQPAPVDVTPVDLSSVSTTPAENVAAPETSEVTDKNGKVIRPVKRFTYTIINNMGKKEKGPFEAESEEEVRNFLHAQDYQVLEIKERSATDIDIGGNGRISSADLSFCLTQLSTYLKAGIPLSDAVRILAKQATKPNLKHHFNQLVYELLKGESLSDAMEMQGSVYPKLLINMVKTAEMTGDLPTILDDMAEYYTSMDQTKKQMKSAMTYPAVVLVIAFGVLIFMLTYLVPQFTSMFADQGAELPSLTKIIIGVSGFIKTKWWLLILVIGVIAGGFAFAYIKYQKFRTIIQIGLMHVPVVKNIIIYNEMANFAKTFSSLLNHSVFITDSMEILSKITNNEIYKGIINDTLEHLSKGDSISTSFKGHWAIPVVAYEMIVTGESTGQLGSMMEKVAAHFQALHKNVIDQMKSLVEPIMICFLAVVVGTILVSIIQPMFSIYSQIK